MILPAMDAFVRKAKLIADLHLPLIVAERLKPPPPPHETSITSHEQSLSVSPEKSLPGQQPSTSGAAAEGEGARSEKDGAGKGITPQEAAAPYWQDPQPPLSLQDCRNMVRYIVQPMKMMVLAWKEACTARGISPESAESGVPDGGGVAEGEYSIRQMLSDFFVYGVRCLDVFAIGAPSSSSQSTSHRGSSIYRSKEEKETIDYFVGIVSFNF